MAKSPQEIRDALARALADGGASTTPEEIKRMIAWQALVDAPVLTQADPDVKAPDQPYRALAGPLDDFAARIVHVFSKTQPAGGLFTQARSAHDITIYPPAPTPALYLVRRTFGTDDFYFAVNQRDLDTAVTITFPRDAGPEIWNPEDGSVRDGLAYHADGKRTMLNLRLRPYQALFVVLRKGPSKQRVTFAPTLRILAVEPDGSAVRGLARLSGRCSVMFADGKMATHVVKLLPPPLRIDSGWRMTTRTPTRRGPVGIVAVRCRRADLAEEKPTQWAAPNFDDSGWRRYEIGRAAPAVAVAAPWKASWLRFEGNNQERLFRKAFDLPEAAGLATVTLTADNGYELFVNARRIGAELDNPNGWREAETFDVAKVLRKGRNVIAVRNTNQGSVGGTLLEARIRLASGKLVSILSDATWKMAQKAADGWQGADFDDSAWQKPDVAGPPPVAPWGDVAGLPAPPAGGQVMWYRFGLPPGARGVHLPVKAKALRLWVDGKEAPVRDGAADLSGRVPAGPAVAALRVAGGVGIDKPILCDCAADAGAIGPWSLIGFAAYSGLADYTVQLDLPDAYRKERLVLDLGEVGCAARLAVNGRDLGTRLWRPYAFDITAAVRQGANTIKVTVANTAATAVKDAPAERLRAGIIGPVRIRCLREITIRAQ